MSQEQANTAPVVEETTSPENTETQETITPAASAAQKAAEQKFFKSLKLKLDGKEVEEQLPFELPDDPKIREYLTRELQLAKTSHTRMQQHTQLQQEVAQFINLLKTNPKEALRHPGIGVDVKALAAQILEEEIENSKKSPEQIEKERLENELKQLRDEREKERKANEERLLQQQVDLEFQKYDDMIDKAIESTPDLPKSPYVVKKVAEYLMLGIQNGLDISAEDVMPLVKEEIQNDIKDMFGAMPDEVVEAFLGKDRLTNIRKKHIAKAKANIKPISKLTDDTGKAAKPKEEKKMTYKEFFRGI